MVWVSAAGGRVDVAAGGLVCVADGRAVGVGKTMRVGDAAAVGTGGARNRFTADSPNNAEAPDATARINARINLCQPSRMRAWRVR